MASKVKDKHIYLEPLLFDRYLLFPLVTQHKQGRKELRNVIVTATTS